ncbi:MAG: glycosyltransferase [Candidatus Scatosoma sp.]
MTPLTGGLLAIAAAYIFLGFFGVSLPGKIEVFASALMTGIRLLAVFRIIDKVPLKLLVGYLIAFALFLLSYLTNFSGLVYLLNTFTTLNLLLLLAYYTPPGFLWKTVFALLGAIVLTVVLFAPHFNSEENPLKFLNINTNGSGYILFLFFFFCVYYASKFKIGNWKGVIFYALAICTFIAQLKFDGRSSLLGDGLALLCLVLKRFLNKATEKQIKGTVLLISVFSLVFAYFYAVILFDLVGHGKWFIMGKDVFTGRQTIWMDSFEQLRGNYLFGIGNRLQSIPVGDDTSGYTNVHHQMLGYLVTFGLAGLLPLLFLLPEIVCLYKNRSAEMISFVLVLSVMAYFDTIIYSTDNLKYNLLAILTVAGISRGKEETMPKTIHYCWFGGAEKSPVILKCIESWKKYCPDYEIKEWNEQNFNIHCNKYVEEAYNAKKWAFVSDYCRFFVLYNYGGIYVDTDVEMIKPLSELPDNFVGFERPTTVASGLIRGAKKGDAVCKEILDSYEGDGFVLPDGKYNMRTVCDRETEILVRHGLVLDNVKQTVGGTTVFPTEYFNPKGGDYGEEKITPNTYTVHHYLASWKSPLDRMIMEYKVKYGVKKGKRLFALRHPILAIKKLIRKDV